MLRSSHSRRLASFSARAATRPALLPAFLLVTGAIASVSLTSPSAHAQTDQQAVEVSLKGQVPQGKQPTLSLIVNKSLANAVIELRAKETTFKEKTSAVAAGRKVKFELPHRKTGRMAWRGHLGVTFADGSVARMPLAFTTEVRGTLQFQVLSTLDELTKEHKVAVKSDASVGQVDVEVMGMEGNLLANTAKEFHGAKPGERLEVEFQPLTDEEIYRIKVTVHDVDAFFRSTTLYPYSFEVPHEEVQFASGEATITAAEAKKLEAVLPALKKKAEQFRKLSKSTGDVRPMQLYIIGHTDTVGSPASNQKLSHRRAVAIGKWLAERGVSAQIFARGFGEKYLAVATADNTDEVRNRRVQYVVAANPPVGARSDWKRVR